MGKENIMMDNRGETQSKPVNFINRKIAALTVAGSMLLSGVGCADRMATTDTSGEITPASTSGNVTTNGTTSLSTSEVTVTPENTSGTKVTANTEATDPKVTVEPATTVGTSAETQYVTPNETTIPTTAETITSAEDLALLAEAGTLDGAETSIKVDANGNKVAIYVSKEGNIYGVEAKTELGQYYANVEFEGEIIGARVLIPEVVKVLYENKLAENPEGENNWVIFVPADISEVKNRDSKIVVEVIDSTSPDYKVEKSGLKVSFGGEKVSISNPIVDWENLGFNNTVDTSFFTYPTFLGGIGNMDLGSGIYVIGSFKFDGSVMNHDVKFATKVAETSDPIYIIEYNSPLDTLEKIEDKNILMNEGEIVFLSDDGTMETSK